MYMRVYTHMQGGQRLTSGVFLNHLSKFFETGYDGLYMLGPRNGTVVRCGLVGLGVAQCVGALRPYS